MQGNASLEHLMMRSYTLTTVQKLRDKNASCSHWTATGPKEEVNSHRKPPIDLWGVYVPQGYKNSKPILAMLSLDTQLKHT